MLRFRKSVTSKSPSTRTDDAEPTKKETEIGRNDIPTFLWAVYDGDTEKAKHWFTKRDIFNPSEFFETPESGYNGNALHWCAESNRGRLIEFLLKETEGTTQEASEILLRETDLPSEIIRELLVFTGDLLEINEATDDDWEHTALTIASEAGHEKVVEALLIDSRLNLNKRDARRWTPLMLAAFNDRYSCVELLCQARCNLFLKDRKGRTAFDLAVKMKRTTIADYLEKMMSRREGSHSRDRSRLAAWNRELRSPQKAVKSSYSLGYSADDSSK